MTRQMEFRIPKRETRRMQRALKKLGRESRGRTVIRGALGPATTPINKAAKANAPRRTGTLRKSIGKITRTYRSSGSVVVVIGARGGFHNPDADEGVGDPAVYATWIEFGTARMAARPFLRPAFDQTRGQARRIFVTEFWKRFEKEIARVRAKSRRSR